MAKFNSAKARRTYPVKGPSTSTGRTVTFEGGPAFTRDTWSDLALLAVTNMVGEDTFYEGADERDDRFRQLVHTVAVNDGEETLRFVAWLRGEANMRSASLVAGVEAVQARLVARVPSTVDGHGRGVNRRLADAPIQRADEVATLLNYYAKSYGNQAARAHNGIAPSPQIPKPIRLGAADAMRRLYNEYSLLKYDSALGELRFGDAIDLVHPSPHPGKAWQGDLFQHALDRRHGRRDREIPESLTMLRKHAKLMAVPVDQRRDILRRDNAADILYNAGMTWESLAGWLQGPMDKLAWETMIPNMGIMALLRNLRNFDEAGVSDVIAATVAAVFTDPEEIIKSRQFPYRYLSAYRAAPSLRWGHALEQALTLATANIPMLPGRTLVLVDTSGSMEACVSSKSLVRRVDVGALFGVALAARGAKVDLIGYATGSFVHPLVKAGSVLAQTEAFCRRVGEVEHGTETVTAVRRHYDGHDRVVIVTDEQTFPSYDGGSVSTAVPANVPMFAVDLGGYAKSMLDLSAPNRYEIGGFSDKLFTMVDLLSRGRDAKWPWQR